MVYLIEDICKNLERNPFGPLAPSSCELVSVGYTATPKKKHPQKGSIPFVRVPSSTETFLSERNLLKRIRLLEANRKLEVGHSEANRHYIFVEVPQVNSEFWNFSIRPDHINYIGTIEAVIFDWSGVLSDDRNPVYESNMRLLESFEKPRMAFEEWLPKTRLTAAEFLRDNGVEGNDEELSKLYKQYFNEEIAKGNVPTVYEDAEQTLDYLINQGKPLALVSSHPFENLKKEARAYGLDKYLIPHIIGDARDKAEGILDACERLDVQPYNALYLGDTIYDIMAAKQAGVHSAAITTGYHVKERLESEHPEFLIESLYDGIRYIIEGVSPAERPGYLGSPSLKETFEGAIGQQDINPKSPLPANHDSASKIKMNLFFPDIS